MSVKFGQETGKVTFLITCGGFLLFDWPSDITREVIKNGSYPYSKIVEELVEKGKNHVTQLLDKRMIDKLSKRTRYISIGVDSYSVLNKFSEPHIELVFMVDLENNNIHWAGKSYPTTIQQKGLIRINDLKTHFLDSKIGKIMILGCHDLTMFNPRAASNAKGWRKKLIEEFKKLSVKEKPVCVLHHPHITVKYRSWYNAWRSLEKEVPTVKWYIGAGKYFHPNRKKSEYGDINRVLEKTKQGTSIDFIVS